MLTRRSFFQLAGSSLLVATTERVRAYSFVGGWALPQLWGTMFLGGEKFCDVYDPSLPIFVPSSRLPALISIKQGPVYSPCMSLLFSTRF